MDLIRNSLAYQVYKRIDEWCCCQWSRSVVVQWLVGQRSPIEKTSRIGLLFKQMCRRLGIERLLEHSVFRKIWLFPVLMMLLAPLLPTMLLFVIACGGFVALLASYGCDESKHLGRNTISGYTVLFAAIFAYATVTSVTVKGSLYTGALSVLFVLCFLQMSEAELTRRQIIRLIYGMLLVGTLVSLYGFYQKLNPGSFRNVWTDADMFSDVTFRVYSTLENPNVLGEYLLLVLPLGAAAVLTADNSAKRISAIIACLAMGVCMVLTYSRGCYLGILCAMMLFLVLLDRRLIAVGIVLLVLSPLYLPASVLSRFASIGNMGDTSTSYRVYIWMGTLAMLKDYWFCGVGPGSTAFNMVYPEYAYSAISAPHSHNLFLQICCDTGICGFLVLMILIVAFYRMMFTAIHREQDRTARLFQISGVSAVTGFLVESMTDYTFYNYRVMLLFWLMLGLSVLFSRMGSSSGCMEERDI